MCDIKNLTDEELKSLSNRIAAELTERRIKEKTVLLKTLGETVKRLYETDHDFYMNSFIRTDCCDAQMEIDLFYLLRDYFDI